MKILIPVISFGKAGGFRVLSELANRGGEGYQVFFVCPSKTKPYYKTNVDIIYINKDGDIVPFEDTSHEQGIKSLISLWRFLKKESNNYDVVIASYHMLAYPILVGSNSVNIYYIQAYEPDFYNEIKPIAKRYSLKFLAWITYFFPFVKIVNSNFYKKYKNIRADYVIEPGLDLTIFYHKHRTFSDEKLMTVGCIGRTEKWKGCDDIVKAIEILYKKKKYVKFKVAFTRIDCPYCYEFERPDGDVNLSDFYRSLDILIATPYLQVGAVHYPVMEAMACGTVVITTGYEPADETNSYIVPIKSPNAIAQAIIEIMSKKSLAIKKAEKGRIDIGRFSWDRISSDFYQVLSSCMKRK